MFWRIFVKELDLPESECPLHGGPVIELEWGWTGGMTEEEMEDLADDAPRGKDSVCTTLDSARELRDRLSEIIAGHEKKSADS